ncbi:hypothetical protein Harman_10600 [Haloarcula mannanilytica]|uniref:DUF7344 domain-containing protein n=1 Tax=Haloarcula mannanilytica TaxID=2509225 RepID=A0A4C2EF91_9EURY|nr:helix-turn-helix transcriptional regulator [Haloarcula mannanilytica]GCF13125.1 hypothetical protein Harman_10600 [Haloarcula mannanilytica]
MSNQKQIQPQCLSAQLEAVQHEDRRAVLFALRGAEQWRPAAAADDGDLIGEPSIPATLYHQHLPKLAEMGLIEWNRETHRVTRGPEYERLRPLLDFLYEYYDD